MASLIRDLVFIWLGTVDVFLSSFSFFRSRTKKEDERANSCAIGLISSFILLWSSPFIRHNQLPRLGNPMKITSRCGDPRKKADWLSTADGFSCIGRQVFRVFSFPSCLLRAQHTTHPKESIQCLYS